MAGPLSQEDNEISGINVTPLVDVVLVLLVIFMITAPSLYQNAINVQLPQTTSGDEASKATLQIMINQAGDLFLDNKPTTLDALVETAKTNHPQAALIMADTKVEHGKVIAVVDRLKTEGIQRFSFGVEKK